jgi:hypothetical protein
MVYPISHDHSVWQDVCSAKTPNCPSTWRRVFHACYSATARYQQTLQRTYHGSRDSVLYCIVPTGSGLTQCGTRHGKLHLRSISYVELNLWKIGQAMRIALVQGMHTDMPIEHLGQPLVQRCRKVWWTIYILDRHMTSLMGLPQSIQDEDITCQLPDFAASPQRAAALNIQIKLARVHAEITRSKLIQVVFDVCTTLTVILIVSCVWIPRASSEEVCGKHKDSARQVGRPGRRTPKFLPSTRR